MSASLIGRLGSSTFRPSAAAASMSLTGSCFSSESAPRPFHHGIRRRGGAIFWSALPSDERQDQADIRTHPFQPPPGSTIPPPGLARFLSALVSFSPVLPLLPPPQSVPAPGRLRGSSSGAGPPHRVGRWAASGDAR